MENIEKEYLFVHDIPVDENGFTMIGMVYPKKILGKKHIKWEDEQKYYVRIKK